VQGAIILIFGPDVSGPQSLVLLYLVAILGIPLSFMSLAVGAVGIGVWKETFAALITGQRTYDTGRLGFALALGYLFPFAAAALAATVERSVRSDLILFMAALVASGGVLLFITLFLIFAWLAAAVSAWLEVILHSGSPRPALVITIATSIGLVVAWGGMAAISPMLYILYRNQLPLYAGVQLFGSAVCLSSVMMWALPLAARFGRTRAASVSSPTWVFLDGLSEVPRQAPLRPGLALMIGCGRRRVLLDVSLTVLQKLSSATNRAFYLYVVFACQK
jgi:hypothetical protein